MEKSKIVIPTSTDPCVLRYVKIPVNDKEYRVLLWDCFRRDRLGKNILGYSLIDPNGNNLFVGEDFYCSPLHPIDSDKTIQTLLVFLTLKPGDVEQEWFDNYSVDQMNFAEADAEFIGYTYCDEDHPVKFEDIEVE